MTIFNKTYDTATPAGSDDPAEADDRMREIKAAVQERENVDHYWPLTGTEVSDADSGEHRKVTLRVGSAPAAVADKGFVYAKDVGGKAELFYRDEDGDEIQLTSGGFQFANDIFLKAQNAAGTGSVNLIKAGTNNLSTLPNSAEMASNAAPVEDEAIANKKYVDDQIITNVPVGAAATANDSESNAMLKAHVYKAQTAGFVNAYAVYTATVQIYVASSDLGPTAGTKIADQGIGVGGQFSNGMVFVAKGNYFDVASAGTPTIHWTPLISGGAAPIDQD